MPPSNQVKLIVWTKAAGRCSFPNCQTELVIEQHADGSKPIGEVAHIVAEQPDGPRGTSHLTTKQRNQPPNLMLLCPSCHTKVDKAPHTFTVERLTGIKHQHEAWVRKSLTRPAFTGTKVIAEPELIKETVHSTVLPVEQVPKRVFLAPPKTFDPKEIGTESLRNAPYILHNKKLITFEDMTQERHAFASVISKHQVIEEDAVDWWDDPDKKRLYVYLLGRCLNKITGRLGLMLDKKRKRYYFIASEPNTNQRCLAAYSEEPGRTLRVLAAPGNKFSVHSGVE